MWARWRLISVTIWFLASRLTGALRQRDAELAATNRRLMAATDERARHMLQTTHQLKAPFAAIHANTQVLLGGYCGRIPDEALQVIGQIAARCDMLSRQIKAMLQLANLRSSARIRPRRRRSNCTTSSAPAWPRSSRWRRSGESASSRTSPPRRSAACPTTSS